MALGKDDLQAWGKALADSLPDGLHLHLLGDQPKRGIVKIEGKTVGFKDIELNAPQIIAALKFFPDRIPGVYDIASALVHCNEAMHGLLFKAAGDKEKTIALALGSAKTYKKLLQQARRLARRSEFSRSPVLQTIKDLMKLDSTRKRKFDETEDLGCASVWVNCAQGLPEHCNVFLYCNHL